MPQENEVRTLTANPHYAGAYRGSLDEAERKGQCPFCKAERQTGALFEVDGWFVDYNPYPAMDRKGGHPTHHLLFICKDHRTDAFSLTEKDWSAISFLVSCVRAKLGFTGGGICWRFGSPDQSGATVLHLHFHLIVPRRIEVIELRMFGFRATWSIWSDTLRSILKVIAPGTFKIITIPVDWPVG